MATDQAVVDLLQLGVQLEQARGAMAAMEPGFRDFAQEQLVEALRVQSAQGNVFAEYALSLLAAPAGPRVFH